MFRPFIMYPAHADTHIQTHTGTEQDTHTLSLCLAVVSALRWNPAHMGRQINLLTFITIISY